MTSLLDRVLREVGLGDDFRAEVDLFVDEGGARDFLGLALGWATLGERMSSARIELKRRPIRKALSNARKIRTALGALVRRRKDIASSWWWWGWTDFGSNKAPWIAEMELWSSREEKLLQLLRQPRAPKSERRPPNIRRYFLIGALIPYIDLEELGASAVPAGGPGKDELRDNRTRSNEWSKTWWSSFLGQLEGKRELRSFSSWLSSRGLKPRNEVAFQIILRGSAAYWAWNKGRRGNRSAEALERFLKRLDLKRFGYDVESAKDRIEKWSVILSPKELRAALTGS